LKLTKKASANLSPHLANVLLPDDPIEHLTGIFKDVPQSMAEELPRERALDGHAVEFGHNGFAHV
jgi:hypothetical protein